MRHNPMICQCPDCGATYSGAQRSGGHCRDGCHRTFRSQSAFDAHRTGPYSNRSCIDVTATEGWRNTDRGWTDQPEMPLAAFATRCRSDEHGQGGTQVPLGTPDAATARTEASA